MALVKHENNNADLPSSPSDSTCAICLGRIRSSARPAACQHSFCFTCLIEWTRVKYECPLCKTQFLSIMRSGGSEYLLPERVQNVPNQNQNEIMITAFTANRVFQGNYIRFRQFIYFNERRAHIISRVVYCPSLYRVQPLQIARLRPWLEREMLALRPGRWADATDALITVLRTYSMDDHHFHAAINEWLGNSRTSAHFRHELSLFSSSYYDMHGWDMNARYLVSSLPEFIPQEYTIDDDNDVEVVDIRPTHRSNLTNVEIITVSDTENVEVIQLDSDNVDMEIIDDIDLTESPVPSPALSVSEPTEGSSSRAKRRKRLSKKSKKRRRSEEDPENNEESQTESDQSFRNPTSRVKRAKSRHRNKRCHRKPGGAVPSDDSSDSDNFPVPRHSTPISFRSVRSVVVVPSKRS